ncbi:MAG: WD40 repeat domain-containing serine/threonine-protein kinase [Acidobacteriota bacterium]
MTRILHAALDLDLFERARYIEESCGDDEDLRREVMGMLEELEDDPTEVMDEAPGRVMRREAERIRMTRPSESLERVGQHRVVRYLGAGGMGVVYEAEQETTRQRVAVKLLSPSSSSPSMVRRFQREAEFLGRLQHPGIARVYEAGQTKPWGEDGPELPYLVMELVDGLNLTSHVVEEKLEVPERVELMAKICDAVEHAHARGVVHRDLKPANILVDANGQPRILDFGVARAIDVDPEVQAQRTGTAQVIGTLQYMSPEQLTGGEVSPATDVYALGVLTYEVLTGRVPQPVAGLNFMEAARTIQEQEAPSLARVVPRLAGDLDAIVSTALEKEPERRYSSAAAMGADLRRYLSEEPILARPTTLFHRARKFVRRNRGPTIAAAVLVAILSTGFLVTARFALRESRARHAAQLAVEQAHAASRRAQLAGAAMALREGDTVAARSHLEPTAPELREWTWEHLHARLDDSLDRLSLSLGRGNRLHRVGRDRLVVLDLVGLAQVRVKEDGELELIEARDHAGYLALSRDGTEVLAEGDGRWWIESLSDSAERRLVSGELNRAHLVDGEGEDARYRWREVKGRHDAYSADGRFAVTKRGSLAYLVPADDPDGGVELGGPTRGIAISEDGEWVVIGTNEGQLRLFATRDHSERWSIAASSEPIRTINFSPEADTIRTVDMRGQVRLWRRHDGQRLATLPVVGHSLRPPSFSPDGSAVVMAASNSGWLRYFSTTDGRSIHEPTIGPVTTSKGQAWFSELGLLVNLDASSELTSFLSPELAQPRLLAGHGSYVYAVEHVPGDRVVSTSWDGTLKVWQAGTGRLLDSIDLPHAVSIDLDASPDGTACAVTSPGIKVSVYELATGRQLARFVDERMLTATFSADGRWLYVVRLEGSVDVVSSTSWEVERRFAFTEDAPGREGSGPLRAIAGDGLLVVVRGDTVWALEPVSGDPLWTWEGSDRVTGQTLSVEAGLVALGFQGEVVLLDRVDGTLRHRIELAGGAAYGLAFHPHEPTLAIGSRDSLIRTWNLEEHELIGRLYGHLDYVHDLDFSDDGAVLVSGSGDATVRLWDTVPLRERRAKALAAGDG